MKREIGVVKGKESGPLTILIGGIHGNESAGIKAIRGVFQTIRSHKIPVKGTLVGLAGNLQAISKNRRFIDYDLNRCWNQEFIDKLSEKEHTLAEDIELRALHQTLMGYSRDWQGPKILMDLHTTSSAKGNFIVIHQSASAHPAIRSLKQPVVVDLDQYLRGTLLDYMREQGFIAFAFEGGMIGSAEAIELHVAGIWELLQAAGNIEVQTDDSFITHAQILKSYSESLPRYLKVLYHHWIELEDQFQMKPGFENFQPVKQGEVVAYDIRGEIAAPLSGMMFLPLYQNSGNDGFFIVEEKSILEPS